MTQRDLEKLHARLTALTDGDLQERIARSRQATDVVTMLTDAGIRLDGLNEHTYVAELCFLQFAERELELRTQRQEETRQT